MKKEEELEYMELTKYGIIHLNDAKLRLYYCMEKDAVGVALLISKHFDLFGLIENGFAIDFTTLLK